MASTESARSIQIRRRQPVQPMARCVLPRLSAVALLVVLAGCTAGGSGQAAYSGAQTNQRSATATISPAATATHHAVETATAQKTAVAASASPTSGLVRGSSSHCPGGLGSAASAGTPALIASPSSPVPAGTIAMGALLQVRLPTTMHWALSGTTPGTAPLQPAGFEDAALHACVWSFQPGVSGTLQLEFTGNPTCDPVAGLCESPSQIVTITARVV